MSEPPNPFNAAMARKDRAIHAAIGPRDVQAIRPHWSDEQAQTFLQRHSEVIGNMMLLAGVKVLRQLVEASEDD